MPLESIPVYKDAQRQIGFEGYAKVIRKIRTGLPFILYDAITERRQTYYALDYYLVEYNGFTTQRAYRRKIKFKKPSDRIPQPEIHLRDKFIKWNGREIY